MRKNTFTFAVVGLTALAGSLTACSDAPAEAEKIVPAVIDTVPGLDVKQVTLTADGAERIALVTGEITAGEGSEMVIPYGAVIYDPDGLSWAYVVKGDNVYLREEITIDRIEGDQAFLTSGPAVGTAVAVVGVAELFGAETGIGK